MKRIAPFLLLAILACDSTSPDHINPTMPAATRSTITTAPLGIELYSDEFCKGGNVWWSGRFNIFFIDTVAKPEVRVYTVNKQGVRTFFGVAQTGVPELEGTDFRFYVDGLAPPDSMVDFIGAGYDANYGFEQFQFDLYDGTHHQFIGTGTKYSDITITSNLFPHACQGIKPRTGCGFVCCPSNNVGSDSQVDGVWSWQIGGDFVTGPCVNSTLRLKAYFIHPNGKAEIFARGDGVAVNEFGGHEFTLTGTAPTLVLSELPVDWLPQFVIVVTSNGTPVGQFDFVAPSPLTPNTK